MWLFRPKVAKVQSRRLRPSCCEAHTVVTDLYDLTFQIYRSANSRPMVVHYDQLKPYLGDRYQPGEVPKKENALTDHEASRRCLGR